MRIERERVAVVTGGASGIGLGLAEAAARRGMRLLLVDLHEERLEQAAARVRETGSRVETIVADVSDADAVERVADRAFAAGSVQLVCSNAGVVVHGNAWQISAADWERVLGVNLMGTVHVIRAFVPRLLQAHRPARLLVTGSMQSVTARAGISPYVAAKHGLLGLCESLHHDLAAADAPIGVTLMMPGQVGTAMSAQTRPESISPDETATIAFAAIEEDRLFAFTHQDRIPEIERRFAAILADGMPGAVDPAITDS